ncbi:MAG: NAD(P)-dependent oxidoreductase, partial [Pontibacterium sp.]
MTKIAFIGLGVMGYPMAGHLKTAGYDVTVYNRTQAKAVKWADEYQGRWAETPKEAAQGANFVLTCVGNDNDLRSVVLGSKGALAGMAEGAILIDHTTASANVARELNELAIQKGVGFIDAPVSGGQAGAENGQLGIMTGASEQDYLKAEPLLKVYAKAMDRMGAVGAGQLTKMVNQICVAGAVQGVAEALAFAKKAGLNTEQVFDVIQHGAGGSWQMA